MTAPLAAVRDVQRAPSRIFNASAVVLMAFLVLAEHFARAAEQPIIIPEIFHRWRLPGDEVKPEITVDEIGKCMGSDLKVRELYDSLIKEGTALERESEEVAKETKSLQSRQAELETADASLAESVKSFNLQGEALERRRADIEKARKRTQTPAEMKAFNDDVARFNKDIATHRRQDGVLKSTLKEHADKVSTYNSTVEKANEKVTAYNARMAPYKAKAEQFALLQTTYKQRCAGQRRITN